MFCSRLKELSGNIEKQYELLRLIVQKMEIRTEADEKDVGSKDGGNTSRRPVVNWSSPLIRQQLTRQTSVVSHWKSLSQKKTQDIGTK